jgi:HAMP domain-containing protein
MRIRVNISSKLIIVTTAAFLIVFAAAAAFVGTFTDGIAQRQLRLEATALMRATDAASHYTDTQISPLLNGQAKSQFLPQGVPFYAAQQIFNLMSAEPGFSFRQPTLNPTNEADRPRDWEVDVVRSFLASPDLEELVTEHQTQDGPVLSVAKPIRVTSENCLSCHGPASKAPAPMVDIYGTDNGFDWKLGDTVGAEIVSVPEKAAMAYSRRLLIIFLGILAGALLVALLFLNYFVRVHLLAPIHRISTLANEVSLGNREVAEFDIASCDELGLLAMSFNRMRRSLATAIEMLER